MKRPKRTPEQKLKVNAARRARRSTLFTAERLACEAMERRRRYANDPDFREKLKQSSRSSGKKRINKSSSSKASRYSMKTSVFAALWQALWTGQDGKCKACRVQLTTKSAHTDHCHITGRIRYLLCRECNLSQGLAGDDPAKLRAIADVLEEWNRNNPR